MGLFVTGVMALLVFACLPQSIIRRWQYALSVGRLKKLRGWHTEPESLPHSHQMLFGPHPPSKCQEHQFNAAHLVTQIS